jgi:signal transduction histidine kinase/DNA-binding response OmpR family regulator
MGSPLRVLLLEDSAGDAKLLVWELEQNGYHPTVERVYTRDAFSAALADQTWDIIIADYSIPQFDGLEALKMVRESNLDIPFIIASGVIGEDKAVSAIKQGAYDYVMKDRMARLGPAVQRALQEAEARRARRQAEEQVRQQNEFLQSVLESIAHPLCVIDANNHAVLMANSAAAAFGSVPEATTCYALTHNRETPCSGEGHPCPLEEVKRLEKPVAVEHIHYDADNNARHVETYGYPVYDDEGNVVQMIEYALDVTERKQAERALQESQRELATIFDSGPVAMILVDQDRKVRKANRAAIALSDRPAEEMLGLRGGEALRCLHSLDGPKGCGFGVACDGCAVRRTVLDTYETGESYYQVEASLPLARGEAREEVHLLVSTTPIDLAEDQLVLVSLEDITERKRAEEEVEKLARFPSENPNPVLRVKRDGTILYANEASLPLFDFWGCQVDQCLPDDWRQLLVDAFDSGSSREAEFTVEESVFSLTFAPVVEAGYANVYGLEITDRKRAEEDLRAREGHLAMLNSITRAALETPDLGTMVQTLADQLGALFGADGCYITLWNEAQQAAVPAAAYGSWRGSYPTIRIEPGEVTATESVLQAGHPLVIEDTLDTPYLSQRIAQLFPDRSLLALPLIADGQKLGAALIAFSEPHRFTPDEVVHGTQVADQIALALAKARLVETLRRHTAELVARNEELDAFAHTAAHDLKNPLGLMIGYADVLSVMLEEDYGDLPLENVAKHVRDIARHGHSMARIIDELLLLAGVRQVEVEREPLDMPSIVLNAQQRLVDMFEKHQAEIVMAGTWPTAIGYAPWVEEAWINYLDNGIKYGGQPPRLELGAERLPDARIRFWVRDNGPGITPEEQSHLFKPFTRLDQADTRGHGLGLSIVRRIIEKLGGEVGVESEMGKGSTFTFTLPAAETEQ